MPRAYVSLALLTLACRLVAFAALSLAGVYSCQGADICRRFAATAKFTAAHIVQRIGLRAAVKV